MFKDIHYKPLYTTGVAAEILQINTKTLINYENYGLTKTSRSQGGRRLYSEFDLFIVKIARYLMKEKGMTIRGVKLVLSLLEKASSQQVDLYAEVIPRNVQKKFFSELRNL